MSGPSRNGRKSNASSLQNPMRPPVTRPASRGTAASSSQSYMSAARNGAGASVASSPAPSIRSQSSRSHRGNVSPTDNARKQKAKEDGLSQRSEDSETNINVVVRCRGRSEREIRESSGVVVSTPGGTRGKEVALSMGPLALSNKLYTFDRVFGPESDQALIYDDVVAPILGEMLSGYNCTIFAYGQTGTGKTYTMSGDMSDNFGTYSDNAGIIPRVLYNLFQKLGTDEGDADNSVKCSFIELYNEELRDLLAADDINAKVKIFDDSTRKNGVVIQGMEETYIKTASDGVRLLQLGSQKRQVAATKCNDLSSRSHTVFTITVHWKDTNEDGEEYLRTGKLNLVDLAGSENIGRSGAENKRAREAGMINQSLLTLGRVINSLVDKSSHVPYRESKLTRLLQDSLGGRTKTSIIATISPAKSNLEETISTLNYASHAKNIRNKPQINQMLTKKAMIREYVLEIERLKGDLIAARQKNGVFLTPESYNEMAEESESRRILLEEHERKIEVLEAQIKSTREQFEQTMRVFLDTKRELEERGEELEEAKDTLQKTEADLSDTKQELAAETVLREAHQKTEEELDVVGNDLISTVDETIGDVDGLHAKIGRLADLEVVNHSTWTKSTSQVVDITTNVEKEIDVFTDEQNRVTDAVASRISSFVEVQTKKLADAYGFINVRLERFNEKEQELSGGTAKSKDDMNQVLEEIKILREDVKTRVGEGLQELNDAAQRIAAEVVEDLSKFGNELHESYSRIGKDFRATWDDAQKRMIAQKAEIEKLRVELISATNAANAAATSAQTSLNTILTEERERANVDRQNLIAQISTLINNSADEQDKRMTKRIESVRSDVGAAQVELEAAAKSYEDGMVAWSADEDKFIQELAESKEVVKQALVEDWQAAEKHNASIQATTQAIHAQTIRLVDAQIENVAVQMQALDEFVTRARSHNEENHAAFVSNLDSLATNARESFDRFGEDTTNVKAEVESFGSEVAAQTAATKEALQPFVLSARQPLSTLRTSIEAAPMKEYVPTGQTPRKRKYVFSRTLPRTESHDKLLEALGISRKQTRPPLEEIEVLSPNKKNPEIPSVMMADPKAGGPGTGAAYYPAYTYKKGLGHGVASEPSAGGLAGVANDAGVRKGGPRTGRDTGSLAAGGSIGRMSGSENDCELGPAPLTRTRSSKRKAVQLLQDGDNNAAPSLLTRKRFRDR